jgi:hypothetical protein
MKFKLLLIVILSLSLNSVTAQNESENSHKKIPELNRNKFLSTSQLKSAFISTNLQTDIGVGSNSLIKIPGITIGDHELFSFQGKIFYMDFNLQYQQEFTSWLSLYMSMKLTGRVGSDLSTIIADGINTISGGDIGWLIKIKETEKLYLSGTIKANSLVGSFINVADYFEDVINDIPYPSLSKKTPATSVGIGLRGAYAFNPSYGLQFDVNAIHGESLQRGATDTYYSFGVLGDVDFKETSNTPIALALGYSLTSTPEVSMNDRGFSSLYLGKIGYSGSDDYELGLQYTFYTVNLKSVDSNTSISKIMLGLKFYF